MAERDPRWFVGWGVERPKRMSVTLGVKADNCPRDAGMYLRYRGQASASQLVRGSFGHLVLERIMGTLIAQGETSLFAPQPGEDPVKAAAEVSQMTKEWTDELAIETGWPLSEFEIDTARQVAYHMAVGNPIDPATVVALERSFILDVGPVEMIGKIDLAALPVDGVLRVRDYKTSLAVPDGATVSELLQVPWYAALLLWGRPYERVECEDCHDEVSLRCAECGSVDGYKRAYVARYAAVDGTPWAHCTGCGAPGKDVVRQEYVTPCARCEGLGYREIIGEPLGLDQYVQWVHCEQVYPRYLAADGMMVARTVKAPNGLAMWSIPDLRGKVSAAARVWERVEAGVSERYWPAKSGDAHCTNCTARAQCPIPAALRRHAGEILTVEQASEAMEWTVRQQALTSATAAEVRAFMKTEDAPEDGRLPVGADEYGWVVSTTTSLKKKGQRSDWDGLQDAVVAGAEEGAPFDIRDWLVGGVKSDFKKLKKEEGHV